MVERFLNLILTVLILATFAPELSSAQAAPGNNSQQNPTSGPKKPLAIIVFSGVAGGLLGLSTLSFYGRPQDKLANIAVGFALGIIGGTIYTTYKAAAAPKDFYQGSTLQEEQDRDRERRYVHGNSPIRASATVFTF